MDPKKLQALMFANDEKLAQMDKGHLNAEVYRTILANTVIPTDDFILIRHNDVLKRYEYLLITRVGGMWSDVRWIFGGRQRIGERSKDALYRLAKREAGLRPEQIKQIEFSHQQDVFNPSSENEEGPLPAAHTRMHVWKMLVPPGFEPILDKTSKDPKWHPVGARKCLDKLEPIMEYLLIQAGMVRGE